MIQSLVFTMNLFGKKSMKMSKEHLKYLKRIKKEKIFVMIMQIMIFLSIIFIWQYLADKEIINTFISSSPKRIVSTIIGLFRNHMLLNNIFITLYEVFISFSLGTLIGLVIASLLWWNKTIAKIIDPYLTIINSLPKIALGPIIIIWVGAKTSSIIIMALLISSIIAIMNIYEGFINTNEIKINMLKSFGASKIQIFTKLILPNSIKNIINVIKVNISMSLIGVIMGEFLVSRAGIGYLIIYGTQIFNLNIVMSGILILVAISYILYKLVNIIENILLK